MAPRRLLPQRAHYRRHRFWEDGLRVHSSRATVVAAAQSSTPFIPPLCREKARVFTLNLRNRLIFKAADEEGAFESADFIDKAKVIKKSWG
jgi:hypothetical protein